ncbi:MAG: DUF5687 family protein [Flavobacteriaceae bacterium]
MKINFINLGWKKFWRSPYWKKSLLSNILLGFLGVYMLVSLLALGLIVYPLMEKANPDVSPFISINNFLPYVIMGDLVFRYFLQKIPVVDIKSFLLLNISKSRIVTYVLNKSIISFFNVVALFFWIPFSVFVIMNGGDTLGTITWVLGIWAFSFINNFTNFLAEKNNFFFGIILFVLAVFSINRYFGFYELDSYWGELFIQFSTHPWSAILPWLIVVLLYSFSRKVVWNSLYLDTGLKTKKVVGKTSNLNFVNRLGSAAPFMKNDIRMIWRNKRPRMTFLMSFLFVFYGLIFFTQEIYLEMPFMLMFAAIFTTGGFAINFGQFIPAWDAKYYNVLMTQRTSYKDYLNSKYILMVTVNIVMFILASFYAFMGWKIYSLIVIGAIYNIGVNNQFLLWAGAFNKKGIDLDGPAVGNMQGSSANQFLMIIPLLGLPAGLLALLDYLFSYEVGLIVLAGMGVLGMILKPYLLNKITKLYIKRKYQTIQAFNS